MPLIMQCPFFKKNDMLKLHCEGAVLKFPDREARKQYLLNFCANDIQWHKCTVCHNLENYYERREED